MRIVEPHHPALQYATDVLDGKVIAGRFVRLAIERDLHDRSVGKQRGLWFDEQSAEKAIRWFGLCRQYVGEFAGQPLNLEPWQQWITWVSYGWRRRDGTRRFRERWMEVASGNGKTTLMAADALLGLVGDAEEGAEIYPVGVQLDQAMILWTAAKLMVEQSPHLMKHLEVFDAMNNRRIIFRRTNSFMTPLARQSRSVSAEGKLPHRVYFDEVHEYRDRRIYDVLMKKTAKRRQPMVTCMTTAGDDEPETLYEELHDYAIDILEGWREDEFTDDSFFAFVAAIDDEDDPFAEDLTRDGMLNMIRKANPNLGLSPKISAVVEEWERAKKVDSKRNSYLRYTCDRRASTVVREITTDEWDVCRIENLDWDAMAETPSIVGIDLSSTRDLTAVTQLFGRWGSVVQGKDGHRRVYWSGTPEAATIKAEPRWIWVYRFFSFLPEEQLRVNEERDRAPYREWVRQGWLELTPGSQIDDDTIAERIKQLDERCNVVQWTSDPWHTKFLVNALQRGAGVELVQFLQDLKSFAEPTMLFLDELRTAGAMIHDGNPVARWCATNVVTKEDGHGNRRPHKRASKKHIDPIVAGIMARGRAIVLDLKKDPAPAFKGNIEFWG